ncbi:hypothetical protein CEXT_90821 [Caerostris extrusa]|uniref:Uncharacterized protein n=1 Tax=Caerostris extrusa TaxID=172846 RepID=A0AAV4P5N3_CAEEX|nr:hypothetical protein CEXT_90821 [Caerostris extrusa]
MHFSKYICRRSTKACPKRSTFSPEHIACLSFESLFRVKTIVHSSPCAEGSTDARRNDGRRRFIATIVDHEAGSFELIDGDAQLRNARVRIQEAELSASVHWVRSIAKKKKEDFIYTLLLYVSRRFVCIG